MELTVHSTGFIITRSVFLLTKIQITCYMSADFCYFDVDNLNISLYKYLSDRFANEFCF